MTGFKNITVGKAGEKIAQEYLHKLGYKIIETNWHYSRNSEIDIIALDNDTLVFAEVKTRTTSAFGHPFEAIDYRKMKKIYSAALAYMQTAKVHYKRHRIDAISVLGIQTPKIEHLKNIGFN